MKRGKKFYNNGEIEICLEDNQDIPEGFIKGRLFKDNVYIFKGTLSKRIKKEFLDQYLKEG